MSDFDDSWDYHIYDERVVANGGWWTREVSFLELQVTEYVTYDRLYRYITYRIDICDHGNDSFLSEPEQAEHYETAAEAKRAVVEAAKQLMSSTLKKLEEIE